MTRALGRYELVRPLARGGMAEVFLARRRAGGVEKLLVVKRIRAERANDVRFQELFKREAKLSMSLAHQNIVPVFDFGRIGDRFFLAMERVEGKDLGSSLAGGRELPPPLVAAFIAAECCQALAYAHSRKNPDGTSRNIVHRDVTPRNLLLSWSGEVKLTDFGISSLAAEDSNKHGTPAYMAPEQARGEPVDVRSDVYGLGMVLREALTGVRGRPGDSAEALLANARGAILEPWPSHQLDPALIEIVDRATAAKPGDRYAEVSDFAAALDDFILAARAAKRGDSPAKQLSSWLARVWGDQREDATETSDLPAQELLSFLDEDGVDMIGTGTQRSLAATAADDDEPALAVAAEERAANPGEEPPAVAAERVTASATSPESPRSVSREGVPLATPDPPRRRGLVIAIVAAVVVLVAFFATLDRGSPTNADAAIALASPDAVDRVVADVASASPPDAADPDSAPVADAAVVEPDAAVADARRDPVVRVGSGSARTGSGSARTGSGSAGSGSAVTVPAGSGSAIATRKVHINATPWAYFTVDGGPKYQTPKLLELTPGPHKIHFENSVLKIERDITLDVPTDRDISYVEPLK